MKMYLLYKNCYYVLISLIINYLISNGFHVCLKQYMSAFNSNIFYHKLKNDGMLILLLLLLFGACVIIIIIDLSYTPPLDGGVTVLFLTV